MAHRSKIGAFVSFLALTGLVLAQTSKGTHETPAKPGVKAPSELQTAHVDRRDGDARLRRLCRLLERFRAIGDREGVTRVFGQLFPPETSGDPGALFKTAGEGSTSRLGGAEDGKAVTPGEGAYPVFTSPAPEKNPSADVRRAENGEITIVSAAERWSGGRPADIRIRKSDDGGRTWGGTLVVGSSRPLSHPSLRQIADGLFGLVYAREWVSGDGDICLARISDNLAADAEATIALSGRDERNPALASDRQAFATPFLYVVYAVHDGSIGSVKLKVSPDLGASWSGEVTIDAFPCPAMTAIGTAVAYDPDRNALHVAYTRPSGGSSGIAAATSTSFGAAWSSPVLLSPAGVRAGAAAIAARGGTAIVVYERREGADGDIGLSYSTDSGKRWRAGADLAATAADEGGPDIRASEDPEAPRFFASYVEESRRIRVVRAEGRAPGSWTAEATVPGEAGDVPLGSAAVLSLPNPKDGDVAGTLWTDTSSDDDVYFSAAFVPLNLATLTVTPANRDVPFTAGTTTFSVAKAGAGQVTWTAAVTAGEAWLSIPSGAGGTNAGTITAAFLDNPGLASRTGSIQVTPADITIPPVTVTVTQASAPRLAVAPAEGIASQGEEGGPFSPASGAYTLENLGGTAMTWTAAATASWLSLAPASGTLDPGGTAAVTLTINADAEVLAAGTYDDTVSFANTTNGAGTTTRPVTLTVNARPGTLAVAPAEGFATVGAVGGPFSPPSKDYLLQNIGATAIAWTAAATEAWISLSTMSGELEAGASATVTATIDADTLAAGAYDDLLSFTNATNGRGTTTRPVTLTVTLPGALAVTPASGLVATGLAGGPFTPSSQSYTLQNTGGTAIIWTAASTQVWTTVSDAGGTLDAGAATTVTVSINAEADALTPGGYSDTVYFTNTANGVGTTTRAVALTVVEPGVLEVFPVEGLVSTGTSGGPFTPSSQDYRLTNTGGAPVSWTATKTQAWLTLSTTSGTLGVGDEAWVTVAVSAEANSLAPGTYNDAVTFTNTANGAGTTSRPVSLTVIAPGALLVSPAGGLASSGLVGGPFTPSVQTYTLLNTGGTEVSWEAGKTQDWTDLSNTSGTLGAGASTTIAVSITAAADTLAAGIYNDTVTFTNATNGAGSTTRPVSLTIATPGLLTITPAGGLSSSGTVGGPFTPSSQAYTLQNTGGTALSWSATKAQAWATLSSGSGSLSPGAATTVTLSINAEANGLPAGTYADTVRFRDQTSGAGDILRQVSLTVTAPGTLAVTPATGLSSSGFTGGPFTPSSQTYTLQNTGGTALSWTAAKTQAWTTLSGASGTLGAGESTTVIVSINAEANGLGAGTYSDTISFNNATNGSGNATRAVSLTVTTPGTLAVSPLEGLVSAGFAGGPFTPTSKIYTLQNTGGAAITWAAAKTQTWTTLSAATATLSAGGSTTVTVSINTWANALATGTHTDTVTFTNTTNGRGTTTRTISLTVGTIPSLSVNPANRDVTFVGGQTTFAVANSGGGTMDWTSAVVAGGDWLTIASGTSGTEAGTITAAFAANRTASPRVGIIRVVAAGAAGSPKDVTVTQAPGTLSLGLGVERLVEKAWIIQREYGKLTVTVANPASIPVDRYVIYRKAADLEDLALAQVPGATVDGAGWTYNDTFLESGTSYTYRVVALDALGNVISESGQVTI